MIKFQITRFVRKDGLADSIDGTNTIRNQSRTFWSEGIHGKSDTNSQVHHYKKCTHPILPGLLVVLKIELVTLY